MGEYADKHSKAERKERVDRMLRPHDGKIDASGYEVPGELHTERKTGPCQPKPRAFAKGGKVEGEKSHHHAGRKSRDTGGSAAGAGQQSAVQALRPQVPTGGLYGSGFNATRAGLMSTAAGLKKGGKACAKAKGGEVPGNNEITGTRPTGGRLARANGGKAKAKGKTNINIIIGSPKEHGPDVPPPPSAIPPGMPPGGPAGGLPPAAMGAMAGPMGGGAGGPPPGMPPQMPPQMPRARGGRAYPIDHAGGGGEGRLEKIKAYGPK